MTAVREALKAVRGVRPAGEGVGTAARRAGPRAGGGGLPVEALR
ncbi:hypothetical protein AB0O01_09245 [Streptomyces sp. NPDC093252]